MLEEFAEFKTKYGFLSTEAGRQQMAATVRAFREKYGKEWFAAFQEQNEDYVFIVDLCANHAFPDAFLKLKEFVAHKCGEIDSFWKAQALQFAVNGYLEGAKSELQAFHTLVKTEIDKPRF